MMDLPINSQNAVRCHKCFEPMMPDAGRCHVCGFEIVTDAPKTFLGKIRRALGIELSADIVSINLEDNGRFFTNQEIEFLLRMENLVVLRLEDVPDYDTMFFQSKRIRKPPSRS